MEVNFGPEVEPAPAGSGTAAAPVTPAGEYPQPHPPNVNTATMMRRHHPGGDNHSGTVPVPHYDQVRMNPFDENSIAAQTIAAANNESEAIIEECRSDECLLLDLGTNDSSDGLPSGPGNENERQGPIPLAVSIDDAIERLGMGRFQCRILWAAGLCFAADSMEVLLLSFLAAVLQVEWHITSPQAATLTSVVFVGGLAGTLTLGPLGDRFGRKPIFTATAAIIAFFGLATAAAQSFPTLLLIRFCVGFGVGGLTVPFDTLAEFIPTSHRGSNLLLVEYFWTAGTLLTPIAAYLTLGLWSSNTTTSYAASWRLFVVACSLPCIASTIVGIKLVPESPRWLLAKGKHDTALHILRKAATTNGLEPAAIFPPGTELLTDDEDFRQRQHRHRIRHRDSDYGDNAHADGDDGSSHDDSDDHHLASAASDGHCDQFRELWSPTWRRTTAFLWLAWAGLAFVYYGTIMVVTRVFTTSSTDSLDPSNNGTNSSSGSFASSSAPLSSSYSFDYGAILASASAEIAGTTLVILTIDRVGRIPSQSACYALGGASVYALCWLASDGSDSSASSTGRTASRASLIGAAFAARLFFMAATCTTWVSTAEILTTEIRTTGHAAANAVARIGGAVSPFLIGGTHGSYKTTGAAMLAISILTAFATWHLPETAGRGLGRATPPEPKNDSDGIVLTEPRRDLAFDRTTGPPSDNHHSVT